MKSKGISPLIAAVLLIAFTMAVASLFAQWAPRLMNQAQGDTTNRTQQIQDCSRYGLDIVDANSTHATIQQVSGDDGIGDLITTWRYTDANPEQNRNGAISEAQGITTVNVSAGDGNTLDEVSVASSSCDTVTAVWSN